MSFVGRTLSTLRVLLSLDAFFLWYEKTLWQDWDGTSSAAALVSRPKSKHNKQNQESYGLVIVAGSGWSKFLSRAPPLSLAPHFFCFIWLVYRVTEDSFADDSLHPPLIFCLFLFLEEAAAISPGYWELFVDLLLVAAASSIADTFLERQTMSGLFEFFLLYMTIIHSWLLYTHHYTSRFKEASLVHTLILFVYMFGMAVTIVNASLKTAAAFSFGVVIQRVAWLVMMVPIGFQIPRAYPFVVVLEQLQRKASSPASHTLSFMFLRSLLLSATTFQLHPFGP